MIIGIFFAVGIIGTIGIVVIAERIESMNNYFNDGYWKCNICDSVFKAYSLGDTQDANFCHYCGNSEIIPCDEDGKEDD